MSFHYLAYQSVAPSAPATGAVVYVNAAGSIVSKNDAGVVRVARQLLAPVYKFQGTTTYTPSSGTVALFMRAIGGGGGGGGANGSGGQFSVGSGGGSGGYSEMWVTTFLTTAMTIQVGAAGAGGTGASNGGDGTDTTFHNGTSTVLRAKAGIKGLCITTGTSQTSTAGGLGGASGSGLGDLLLSGSTGGAAWRTSGTFAVAGAGAPGYLGMGGGTQLFSYANGQDGGHYGAGGSGAASENGAGACNGGAGSDGLLMIWEFV